VLNIENLEIVFRNTLEKYLKLAEDHPNYFFINDYYPNNIQIMLDEEIDYENIEFDRPIKEVCLGLQPFILLVNYSNDNHVGNIID